MINDSEIAVLNCLNSVLTTALNGVRMGVLDGDLVAATQTQIILILQNANKIKE